MVYVCAGFCLAEQNVADEVNQVSLELCTIAFVRGPCPESWEWVCFLKVVPDSLYSLCIFMCATGSFINV